MQSHEMIAEEGFFSKADISSGDVHAREFNQLG